MSAFGEALASVERLLSLTDQLRRSLGDGRAPIAEVYLEATRSNLHHVRDALMNYGRRIDETGLTVEEGPELKLLPGGRLCRPSVTKAWVDQLHPQRPDLGADIVGSEDARAAAQGWYSGGMLKAALADHAWLHLGSGLSWSSDGSGAGALVEAMNGGRAVATYRVRGSCGIARRGDGQTPRAPWLAATAFSDMVGRLSGLGRGDDARATWRMRRVQRRGRVASRSAAILGKRLLCRLSRVSVRR